MKTKSSLLLLFSSLTITAFAQLEKETVRINKWQLGVNVNTVEPITDAGFDFNELSQRTFSNGHKKDNSYCVGLNLTYKIKENCAVRLSTRMTKYKVTETVDFREFSPPGSDYGLNSSDIQQTMFAISPGILWNSNYKKLNFYGGFQLVYRQYSSVIGNTYYRAYLTSNNAPVSFIDFHQTEPGGFSLGAGSFAGFSINILKNVSIGSEFSTAYSYYKTGGAITTTKTLIFPNYLDAGTSVSGLTFEGSKFSSLLSTINLSISF